MTNENPKPTKAEFLANLVTGYAGLTKSETNVQRSHRFPLHLFTQIENLAKVAGVPASVIINQLIECGLEAVRQELPDEVLKQLCNVSQDQLDLPRLSEKVEVKGRNLATRNKPKSK